MIERPKGSKFYYENDVTTRAQFEQEAQLWSDAFKKVNGPKPSASKFIADTGIVLHWLFSILNLVFYCIGRVFTWLFSEKKSEDNTVKETEHPPMMDVDKFNGYFDDAEVLDFYETN